MKYALAELQAPTAARPRIEDGGRRAGWRVDGPRMGDSFVFVLFHEHGVVEWERRIQDSSIAGRAKRLIGHIAHPARP